MHLHLNYESTLNMLQKLKLSTTQSSPQWTLEESSVQPRLQDYNSTVSKGISLKKRMWDQVWNQGVVIEEMLQ
jgi:hypothetical protein